MRRMMVVRMGLFDPRGISVLMVVTMSVRMAGCMSMGLGMMRSSIPPEKQGKPQARDDQPGCGPEPGIEVFGHDVARGKQGDDPEEIHPCRMARGDDHSQHEGVPGSSP